MTSCTRCHLDCLGSSTADSGSAEVNLASTSAVGFEVSAILSLVLQLDLAELLHCLLKLVFVPPSMRKSRFYNRESVRISL